MLNFCNDDELMDRKETFLKAILQAAKRADIELDLPCLPKRHGKNKGKLMIDDVFRLFTIADERKFVNTLPCLVADDLSRVPQLNAESVNMLHIKKIESLEQRFDALNTTVEDACKLMHSQTEHQPLDLNNHQPSEGSVNTMYSGSLWQDVVGHVPDWAVIP